MPEVRDSAPQRTGVVIIGRNEGERLRRCAESVLRAGPAAVVYVDSGSRDGSPDLARNLGIPAVELDSNTPFSAARGRNAGLAYLHEKHPGIEFVQFIDGDCELRSEWLGAGGIALDREPECAIVAGWLRERSPERSVYNRLADLEWNFSGTGEVDAVGGIFLARLRVVAQHGGFDPTLAAGEEPELCARVLAARWRIRRIDAEMALHDLAMTRFGQWWRRSVRFGYGSLEVARRAGLPPFVRANRRARFWGLWCLVAALLVLMFVTGAIPIAGAALPIWLLGWPAQWLRIVAGTIRRGVPTRRAAEYALFVHLSNFPHLVGQGWNLIDRWRGQAMRVVEHKSGAPT